MDRKLNKQIFPYSYHTFLYPFQLICEQNTVEFDNNWSELENAVFNLNSSKLSDKLDILNQLSGYLKGDPVNVDKWYSKLNTKLDALLNENTKRYFLPIARNRVFPDNNDSSCKKYIYEGLSPDYAMAKNSLLQLKKEMVSDIAADTAIDKTKKREITENIEEQYNKLINMVPNSYNRYIITLADDSSLVLTLNGISVTYIPEFKIGVLRIEAEYYPQASLDDSTCFENTKRINEHGRRVFTPCYDASGNGKLILTAKKIEIKSDEKSILTVDFPSSDSLENLSCVQELLFGSLSGNMAIKSILDDRMYVTCLVRDNNLSEAVKSHWKDQRKEFLASQYEFAFIDTPHNCSCQNEEMLTNIMQNHSYNRWSNYGTIQYVCEYAMTCITDENPYTISIVVNPFLTEYVEIVQLSLLQRSIMVALEEQAEQIANEKDSDAGQLDRSKVKELWKKYIYFQNTYFMREVTFQQQGIELYDMLKKSLRIIEMNDYLGQEIHQFEEYSEMQASDRQSELTSAFTEITLIGVSNTVLGLAKDCTSVPLKLTCFFIGAFALAYLIIKLIMGMLKLPRNKKTPFIRPHIYIFLALYVLVFYGSKYLFH